jgi:hypothetical protein
MVPASRKLRKFLVEHRNGASMMCPKIIALDVLLDSRYRDTFGLRPDLVNNGIPRDEIDRIIYDRKVFHGINKVLDTYLDTPLSHQPQLARRVRADVDWITYMTTLLSHVHVW